MGWINWNIAGHPLNWLKIGIMAVIFAHAMELACRAVTSNKAPAPNIQP